MLIFYWFGLIFHGVWEVPAVWVIGLFVLKEVAYGLLKGALGVVGGVGHFAYVGGALAGVLVCAVLRAKRDTAAMSEARALKSDMKDLSLVPLHALRTMHEEDPTNPDIIRAMIKPAIGLHQEDVLRKAMAVAGPGLLDSDPELAAYYVDVLHGDPGIFQARAPAALGQSERALRQCCPGAEDLSRIGETLSRCHRAGDGIVPHGADLLGDPPRPGARAALHPGDEETLPQWRDGRLWRQPAPPDGAYPLIWPRTLAIRMPWPKCGRCSRLSHLSGIRGVAAGMAGWTLGHSRALCAATGHLTDCDRLTAGLKGSLPREYVLYWKWI